jgi:hypothetical protein
MHNPSKKLFPDGCQKEFPMYSVYVGNTEESLYLIPVPLRCKGTGNTAKSIRNLDIRWKTEASLPTTENLTIFKEPLVDI